MRVFNVTVLGCGSATPTTFRNPTAQLVNLAERFFLIDCGEGTQMQLRKFKQKFQRIDHILISHLHGDHYLGLIGLLSSMHLLGRKKAVNIYAHPALKQIIDIQLEHSQTVLNYPIVFKSLSYTQKNLLFEDQIAKVYSFPLNHRIPTCGFIIEEHVPVKTLNKLKIEALNLTISQLQALKRGEDILHEGRKIANQELTLANKPSRSYAYCSDTCYDKKVIETITGSSLLYHEATFLDEMADRARATFHTTAKQAGLVAKEAGVKQLLIGHFSARYLNDEPLLLESQAEFPNTLSAQEGTTYSIPN